ncbi:MAG: cyclopropane-fatty-acyl-phospholipid synthase family protein [Gammaproteobacteria bacterium]|nr:cyclopropane-fatty-acyl-phospholipid synthase family protein [Gammaproteobacteria bacterium]MDH3563117.1 cyclopropane-fatty-acyl-phospholipid synthase family protein [Gammaproteobacteria bacterium]
MNIKYAKFATHAQAGLSSKPALVEDLAKRILLARLKQLVHGQVDIVDGTEVHRFGQRTERCPLSVTVHVYDSRFYCDIVFGGSIGAGEAYMSGYWFANDLTALVRLLIQNREVLDGMETGLARLATPARKLFHWMNRNSHDGSRRNIAAHYDLGNDFFRLMLDETLMYSAAIFERPGMTLAEAQRARLDRICRKLALGPRDHVLEIGTGWGGFALHAAAQYGCRVTTTTISREQHALAQERIAQAGLSDRVTVLREDYRDLRGEYDKLVSIEMIEAVGHEYYETFFAQCGALLKPDGLMLLQAITIADQRYEAARKSVDFIQRYIFPGSCIPSVSAMANAVARATDLRIVHLEDIGPHYATTLRHWRENLYTNADAVRQLGVSEEFLRMWEFYLCYCEGGFAERALGDAQLLLAKPQNRHGLTVPELATLPERR